MKDLRAKLENLQADAEDCLLISRLATDRAKQELFAHLAAQLQSLAEDIEIVIARKMPDKVTSEDIGRDSQSR